MITLATATDPPQMEAEVSISEPDGDGNVTASINLGPAIDVPNTGASVIQRWIFQLPGGYRITQVWTFYGVDRDNAQEGLIELASAGSIPFRIYQRSPHKEINSIYESWDQKYVWYTIIPGQWFTVYTLSHSTNTMPGHVQFGMRLYLERIN